MHWMGQSRGDLRCSGVLPEAHRYDTHKSTCIHPHCFSPLISLTPAAAAPVSCVVHCLSSRCVSEGMAAGLTWMASVYAAGKGCSTECLGYAARAVAIGAAYKTVPVREAAASLAEAMVLAAGAADVASAVAGLDKAARAAAGDALAKAGVTVGATGATAAPSAAAGGTRTGAAGAGGSAVARSSASSRPGTAAAPARSGGVAGSSRPSTAPGGGRAGAPAGSRAGSAVAAAAGGDEGPLLCMDSGKEERSRKVRCQNDTACI